MKKDIRNYKVNGKQFSYILDSITPENYDLVLNTDKEKVQFFFDTFNKECNNTYYKKCYPSLKERLSNYLQGLPNCINVAYSFDQIEDKLISFGYNLKGYRLEKAVENWFSVCAMRLIQLANYYNIDLDY